MERPSAPERFVEWLTRNVHTDELGYKYRYHPRSDNHSNVICALILSDLLDACPLLEEHAVKGLIAFGINYRHVWEGTRKPKTIDLALGTMADGGTADLPEPEVQLMLGAPRDRLPSTVTARTVRIHRAPLGSVLMSCEAKAVMTEHAKSQPRLFDELSSSHEIVHRGRRDAIAAGLTVVNAAQTFMSPLRQRAGRDPEITRHRQPQVTENMIAHLRGRQIRQSISTQGFDAYASVVIDCDNRGPARLVEAPPAPQPGDPDHYDTFVGRIAQCYVERFSALAVTRRGFNRSGRASLARPQRTTPRRILSNSLSVWCACSAL